MTKHIGIWIDKSVAKIVTLENSNEVLHEIHSEIESFKPSGGSGSKVKGGPQDVVQDKKFIERFNNQQKRFFKDIASFINTCDALVIFGPAQMGENLYKEFSKSYTTLSKKIVGVQKADSMTDNQIKAWVRDYYS